MRHTYRRETNLYKNIILSASFQSVGHVDEYFIQRTRNLIIIYTMPRMQGHTNEIHIYENGTRINVIHTRNSTNPFLYYVYWFMTYWYVLLKLRDRKSTWTVFAGHPIFFFFMFFQRIFLGIRFAYWIGDYFPTNDWKILLYEKLKKYYHDRIATTYYLSDRINKCMNNGQLSHSVKRRTVAWGMKRQHIKKKTIYKQTLAFVGVMKPSQNIELILKYIHEHPRYKLKLIGVCENTYVKTIQSIIKRDKLEHRVWFPNSFVPEDQLGKELEDCCIGLALYKSDKSQFTWYTDPGKIKTYLEFGLPVIMSDTSAIKGQIIQLHCGEIVKNNNLDFGVKSILRQYSFYQNGVKAIVRKYEFYKHYDTNFVSLESID